MAGFSRRPATRERVSSTQEESTEDDLPPLNLDGEDTQQQERIELTQIDDYGAVTVTFGNSEYTPQYDNPSQHLPGDENDCDTALEEFLSSESSKNPVDNGEQEFSLEIEPTDEEEEEEEDDNSTVDNNNNVPSYTQMTTGRFHP